MMRIDRRVSMAVKDFCLNTTRSIGLQNQHTARSFSYRLFGLKEAWSGFYELDSVSYALSKKQ
jgi:hypothetical protein